MRSFCLLTSVLCICLSSIPSFNLQQYMTRFVTHSPTLEQVQYRVGRKAVSTETYKNRDRHANFIPRTVPRVVAKADCSADVATCIGAEEDTREPAKSWSIIPDATDSVRPVRKVLANDEHTMDQERYAKDAEKNSLKKHFVIFARASTAKQPSDASQGQPAWNRQGETASGQHERGQRDKDRESTQSSKRPAAGKEEILIDHGLGMIAASARAHKELADALNRARTADRTTLKNQEQPQKAHDKSSPDNSSGRKSSRRPATSSKSSNSPDSIGAHGKTSQGPGIGGGQQGVSHREGSNISIQGGSRLGNKRPRPKSSSPSQGSQKPGPSKRWRPLASSSSHGELEHNSITLAQKFPKRRQESSSSKQDQRVRERQRSQESRAPSQNPRDVALRKRENVREECLRIVAGKLRTVCRGHYDKSNRHNAAWEAVSNEQFRIIANPKTVLSEGWGHQFDELQQKSNRHLERGKETLKTARKSKETHDQIRSLHPQLRPLSWPPESPSKSSTLSSLPLRIPSLPGTSSAEPSHIQQWRSECTPGGSTETCGSLKLGKEWPRLKLRRREPLQNPYLGSPLNMQPNTPQNLQPSMASEERKAREQCLFTIDERSQETRIEHHVETGEHDATRSKLLAKNGDLLAVTAGLFSPGWMRNNAVLRHQNFDGFEKGMAAGKESNSAKGSQRQDEVQEQVEEIQPLVWHPRLAPLRDASQQDDRDSSRSDNLRPRDEQERPKIHSRASPKERKESPSPKKQSNSSQRVEEEWARLLTSRIQTMEETERLRGACLRAVSQPLRVACKRFSGKAFNIDAAWRIKKNEYHKVLDDDKLPWNERYEKNKQLGYETNKQAAQGFEAWSTAFRAKELHEKINHKVGGGLEYLPNPPKIFGPIPPPRPPSPIRPGAADKSSSKGSDKSTSSKKGGSERHRSPAISPSRESDPRLSDKRPRPAGSSSSQDSNKPRPRRQRQRRPGEGTSRQGGLERRHDSPESANDGPRSSEYYGGSERTTRSSSCRTPSSGGSSEAPLSKKQRSKSISGNDEQTAGLPQEQSRPEAGPSKKGPPKKDTSVPASQTAQSIQKRLRLSRDKEVQGARPKQRLGSKRQRSSNSRPKNAGQAVKLRQTSGEDKQETTDDVSNSQRPRTRRKKRQRRGTAKSGRGGPEKAADSEVRS